jgi:hypothetical protein
MSKTTEVILPEELLRNSLLLFEDELSEEETADLPEREEGSKLPDEEKTDSAIPTVKAEDAIMAVDKTVMDLENQDTRSHYLRVRKELAQYLQDRQQIVEEIRQKILAKDKSSDSSKFSFRLTRLNSGIGFKFEVIPKTAKSSKLAFPRESSINKVSIETETKNKNIAFQENNKEKKIQGNIVTGQNKVIPQSKGNRIVRRQKPEISKQKAQTKIKVNSEKFKPQKPCLVGILRNNCDLPANKAGFSCNNGINDLKNQDINNDLPERILPRAILPRVISPKRSKANYPELRLTNKPGINKAERFKRTNNEKPCVPPRRALLISACKQDANKLMPVNQVNLLFKKVGLYSGECGQSGNKENKMSMQDPAREKKNMGLKRLSLNEDKKNNGFIFKL